MIAFGDVDMSADTQSTPVIKRQTMMSSFGAFDPCSFLKSDDELRSQASLF